MSLLFTEGFEHYGIASTPTATVVSNLNRKFHVVSSGHTITSGRTLGKALNLSGNVRYFFPENSTIYFGFAFNRKTSTLSTTIRIVELLYGSNSHVDFRLNLSGNIFITRNGTTLATGSSVLSTDTWYYIELEITISDTGIFNVYINESPEITFSGDTRNASSALIDNFSLNSLSGGLKFDDMYISDSSLLGNTHVITLFPTANGTSSVAGWTPNLGSKFETLDEITPDDDTSYVESTTVGSKDTFEFQNIASYTSGNVLGVEVINMSEKDPGLFRNIRPVIRESSTDYSGNDVSILDLYSYAGQIYDAHPNSSPWTIDLVDDSEYGFELVN